MNSIAYRKFEKFYGVNLLPYATETTLLCELMHVKGLFTKTLEYENSTVLDYIKIDASKKQEILDQLKKVATADDKFPNIIINNDFHSSENLKVPIINLNLSGDIDVNHVINFTLTNVKSKRLFGSLETSIRTLVDDAHESNKELKHKKIITQLFYADSVELKTSHKIDTDVQSSLDNSLSKNVTVSPKNNDDGSSSYTFSGTHKIPFAAQLVSGNHW